MAVVDVKVPTVGESVQEAMVHKWHKKSGDPIALDEVLVELETDKATVEVVAEAAGTLTILVQEGVAVAVGSPLAKIDTSSGAATSSKTSEPPSKIASAPAVIPPPPRDNKPAADLASPPAPARAMPLSPAVNRMVAEHNLNPNIIPATGRDGRILKGDVIAFQETSPGSTSPSPQGSALPKQLPQPAGERRVPMSMMRRRIAERLVQAQQTAALLTTFNEVDMSALKNLRGAYKDKFKERHGVNLGFMGFFVKAAIEALKSFPAINGWIDGQDIVYHDYFDIGVAVSTEKGLVVPVLRQADQMSLAGIEAAIGQYAQKARDGKISIDDLSGGTFTISNGGVFGSLVSTPIVNPPQSAILGMHKIMDRPVVIEGQIVARPMMYLALTYDHRVVDGREAVQFLVKIKECIEEPARLLLGV